MKTEEQQLDGIIDALCESVLGETEEEILMDAKSRGEDIDATANKIKNVMLGAVADYVKRHKKAKRGRRKS